MIDQVDVCGVVQSSNVILCEIQSGCEAGYLVNAHTAEVAIKHLARKKIAENCSYRSSQEQNGNDIRILFLVCSLVL